MPQDSVLGPILLNIFYGSALRLGLPERAMTSDFSNDLALTITAVDKEELLYRDNQSLRCIGIWMGDHGPEIALLKADAVLLKRLNEK